jgi:Cysteine-rich secretory protein family
MWESREGIISVLRKTASAALSAACVASVSKAATIRPSEFPERILAAHNVERARAGMPPLVWDNNLGVGAAAYAQQMAFTGVFQHSNRQARRGIGENLWMGSHGAFSFETMVSGWASEKRFFRPGIFPNNSSTGNWEDVGHYTQMIWPATTRVGCALASTVRTDYLVCRYATAGNIDGRRVP